jgi:hypothetical protein
MDQDDPNAQGTEHGDIQENIGKILAGDDGRIHAEHEDLFPEARDVLQNGSQIGQFHFFVPFLIQTEFLYVGRV